MRPEDALSRKRKEKIRRLRRSTPRGVGPAKPQAKGGASRSSAADAGSVHIILPIPFPAPARSENHVAKKNDALQQRANQILQGLAELYPDAKCALNHKGPLQLLVATILSAQCTDVRVNMVTPALFARYPDAAAFADAEIGELEKMIQSTGFFRNKAKSIVTACQAIVREHGGQVPGTMEELVKLPGVGRKTANVVLGNAFDTPGITVDTHVQRLSRRFGLTKHEEPEKIERDLMALVPQPEWTKFSHRTIFHGRQVCFARKPNCAGCTLADVCPKIGVEKKHGARSAEHGANAGSVTRAKAAAKRAIRPAKGPKPKR
jgi:endonuclease III